jgi:hypothetical protein
MINVAEPGSLAALRFGRLYARIIDSPRDPSQRDLGVPEKPSEVRQSRLKVLNLSTGLASHAL